MAEDSGAFKTNPLNSGRIPAFVMIRERSCNLASTVKERLLDMPPGIHAADFNKR
jgi:hypothetical protein